MAEFTTYESQNAANPNERWVAYLHGFKVFCFGATEQAAKERAESFWRKERARMAEATQDKPKAPSFSSTTDPSLDEGRKDGRGHANTGKVWMHHPDKGFARVVITEISMYEANGYTRKGPRSK